MFLRVTHRVLYLTVKTVVHMKRTEVMVRKQIKRGDEFLSHTLLKLRYYESVWGEFQTLFDNLKSTLLKAHRHI